MKTYQYLLIASRALPQVYQQVVTVKELISSGEASNISDAVKRVGISRSAFYKYKDYVFPFVENDDSKIINISAILSDRAGVFSALTAKLYEKGVNILTINQNLPVDGTAAVTLSVRTDKITVPLDELIANVRKIDGVISVKAV